MKKIVKSILAIFLAIFAVSAVSAQSSEILSEIIKTEEVTYGQVSYLVQAFFGKDAATYSQSFNMLKEDGTYFSDKVCEDDKITVAAASKIFAKAIGVKGGIFYTVSKSGRYAMRELKAKQIIPANADPSMKLSGRDAIAMISGCIEAVEEKAE